MTVSTYLDSVLRSDGSKLIMFAVSIHGKRKRISSGIHVIPDSWNGREILETMDEPLAEDKNILLKLRKQAFKKAENYAELHHVELTHEIVRAIYNDHNKIQQKDKGKPKLKEPMDQHRFSFLVDELKEKRKNRYSDGKKRQFKQVVDALERYKPKVRISDITEPFLNGYCDFLISEGKENSTIKMNHLKNIKVVYEFASKTLGIPYPEEVENFTWFNQRKQQFSPTWKEVDSILNISPDQLSETENMIRESFLVTCFTGLRDSDFREVSFEMIEEQSGQNFLRVSMEKTQLDYSIPISDEVWAILQKYNFNIPLFSQQYFNVLIKKIAGKCVKGKYVKYKFFGKRKIKIIKDRSKMFTTHSARRFFGRNWVDLGGSIYVLMKIYGHTSIETTLRYIGYQPQEITEEYQKVMDNHRNRLIMNPSSPVFS